MTGKTSKYRLSTGSLNSPSHRTVSTVICEICRKLQPGLIQWSSDKPDKAKTEITIRFGANVGDVNIVARASVNKTNANALSNEKKAGQTYSETDVSQFVLTTADSNVLLRDAPRDAALLFTTNVTFLHVEVSCSLTLSPIACAFNDDMVSLGLDHTLANDDPPTQLSSLPEC